MLLRCLLSTLSLIACGLFATASYCDELPVIVEEDFEQGADRWETLGESQWQVIEQDGNKVYRVEGKGKYNPPHRSPVHIALLKDVSVGDFVLTADVQSTSKIYGHQDMCLFFNFVDPGHFYYVHLGRKADPHANQIFIVNDAPRKAITKQESPGTDWSEKWHKVKIVRRTADGTIEVYFDDMETPAMTAQDKSFTSGRIGLGTFDDNGHWDNVVLRGKKVE